MLRVLSLCLLASTAFGRPLSVEPSYSDSDIDEFLGNLMPAYDPSQYIDFTSDFIDNGWSTSSDTAEDFCRTATNFVVSAASVYLEQLIWSGVISIDEKETAWQEFNGCLEKIEYDEDTLKLFMDWPYLGEFLQWQVTKAKFKNNENFDVGMSLVPLRFREDISKAFYGNVDPEYIVTVILFDVCIGEYQGREDELNVDLDTLQENLNEDDLAEFFEAIQVEEYKTAIDWGYVDGVCFDSQLKPDQERSVIKKMRSFAAARDIDKCQLVIQSQMQYDTVQSQIQYDTTQMPFLTLQFVAAAPPSSMQYNADRSNPAPSSNVGRTRRTPPNRVRSGEGGAPTNG